jgi:hypothetical protein
MVVSWRVVVNGSATGRRAMGAIKEEFDLSFKQIFMMNLFA